MLTFGSALSYPGPKRARASKTQEGLPPQSQLASPAHPASDAWSAQEGRILVECNPTAGQRILKQESVGDGD